MIERVRHETGIGYHHVGFPDGTLRRLWHNPRAFRYSETYGTYLPLVDFTKQEVEILDPRKSLKKRWGEDIPQFKGIRSLIEQIRQIDPSISPDQFGLDASLLVGIEKKDSDIDLTFHGNPEQAMRAYLAYEEMKKKGMIVTPTQNMESLVKRRRPYSTFASNQEIVQMEERKMSGYVNVGGERFKFSILPVDPTVRTDFSLQPRGMICAVSGTVDRDRVMFEPDLVELGETEMVYGPSEVKIDALCSALPSKTGLCLQKGDRLFTMGEIMTMKKADGKELTVVGQFPWTEFAFGGKKLTTNILQGNPPKWRQVADYMLQGTFGKPPPEIDDIQLAE